MTNIDEIRARAEQMKGLADKATKGPWFPCGARYTYISRDLNNEEIEDIAEVCNHFRDDSQIEINKQFIAASRENVPWAATTILELCGEIERLKEIISYLPKVPTQPYEKELAKRVLDLQNELAEKDAVLADIARQGYGYQGYYEEDDYKGLAEHATREHLNNQDKAREVLQKYKGEG